MKKKWIAAFIIYLALVAACIVVVYVVPSLKGMLEKTYVTEYGKIDITDEVSAFIVRDETVYVAPQDCKLNRLAEPDKLVKAKTHIVELTPIIDEAAEAAAESGPDADQAEIEAAVEANEESQDNISRKYSDIMESLDGNVRTTKEGYNQQAGYISYFVDGVESLLSTDKIGDLKKSDYEKFTDRKAVETPEKKCGKGEPIFKVISNRRWYLVFYIDNKDGEKYYEGRTVSVDIAGKNVPVKVAGVQTGKKETKVILSCKMFFEGFLQERSLKTTITVASAEGLVLQDSSIVMKGEQKGVFVKNKLGEHRFKPISIKADDGERCVVYSDIYVDEGGNFVETLSTYDEIVAEPDEEEIAALQEQAKKEAAEKAAAEKAAKEKAAKEKAAKEKAEAEKKAAEKAAKKKAAEGKKAAEEKAAAEKKAAEEKAAAEKSAAEQAGTDAAAAESQGTPETGSGETGEAPAADKNTGGGGE